MLCSYTRKVEDVIGNICKECAPPPESLLFCVCHVNTFLSCKVQLLVCF